MISVILKCWFHAGNIGWCNDAPIEWFFTGTMKVTFPLLLPSGTLVSICQSPLGIIERYELDVGTGDLSAILRTRQIPSGVPRPEILRLVRSEGWTIQGENGDAH